MHALCCLPECGQLCCAVSPKACRCHLGYWRGQGDVRHVRRQALRTAGAAHVSCGFCGTLSALIIAPCSPLCNPMLPWSRSALCRLHPRHPHSQLALPQGLSQAPDAAHPQQRQASSFLHSTVFPAPLLVRPVQSGIRLCHASLCPPPCGVTVLLVVSLASVHVACLPSPCPCTSPDA